MTRGRRRLRYGALIAVIPMVIAACGGADTPAAPAAPQAPAATPAPDAAPGERVATVHLPQGPRGFNPLIPQITGDQLINQLHHAGLVMTNGSREYIGRAASDWSVSADGRTWTFTLDTSLGWSDGTPFTIDDVIFSYELWANPASGSSLSGVLARVEGVRAYLDGDADSVSGFRAVDAQTFQIELTEPNVAFIDSIVQPIMHILPKHVLGGIPLAELSENPWFREPTTGLGPYVFSRWITDDEIEFVPNPSYPAELGIDRLFARVLTTEVAGAQLETGEIDLAQLAATSVPRFEALAGVTVHRQQGVGIMALHSALDAGKLADPKVRAAILHAIDRQAIVDSLLAGEGVVVDTLVHGPSWAVPSDLPTFEYDPDRARELLAESGFDTSTLIRFETTATQTVRLNLATIAAGQLQAVGLSGAVVVPYEPAALSEALGQRDFDLLISEYGNFATDPHSMTIRLGCDFIPGSNIVRYCNPELDDLLRRGIATPVLSERTAIYGDAQRIFTRDLPILPLYVANSLFGTSQRFQGFQPHGAIIDAFWNAPDWTVQQ